MNTCTFDRQIPLLLRNLENALRAGYNLQQCFEIVARDVPAPMGAEAAQVVAEVELGISLHQAFDNWLQRVPSRDLDLIVATIRVQYEIEGNLADMLKLLAQIMGKRADLLSA
jgi:tight adherence protein B